MKIRILYLFWSTAEPIFIPKHAWIGWELYVCAYMYSYYQARMETKAKYGLVMRPLIESRRKAVAPLPR